VIKGGLPAERTSDDHQRRVRARGLEGRVLGAQAIRDGDSKIVIAAAVQESMSMAPHLLPGSRRRPAHGDWKLVDSMIDRRFIDVTTSTTWASTPENVAKKYEIGAKSRTCSRFTAAEGRRGAGAGRFKDEIVAFSIAQKKGRPDYLRKR